MTDLEQNLRVALRDRAHAMSVPDRPPLDRDVVSLERRQGARWLVAAACLALVGAGVAALALPLADDPEPAPTVNSVEAVPTSTVAEVSDTTSAAVENGWIAFDSDRSGTSDIYLVRPGESARPLEVAGSDEANEMCPAWSPDGTRLVFGRVTGSSATTSPVADIVIVPVGAEGTAGSPTIITIDGFDTGELPLGSDHPCGVWAPDGRWVALGGNDEVWLVDTQNGEVRRVPDLPSIDLEWRPGTDQLAIAGDMRATDWSATPVSVYSVSTAALHRLGSVRAMNITWSPDGSTLAYTGDEPGLWLVDADGTNRRMLVADIGDVNHGIGPVWSPTGESIVYQRLLREATEKHEVVLVDVTDGSETAIEHVRTDDPGGPVRWFPWNVTWSPDGTTLLYVAWGSDDVGPEQQGVIAVPAVSAVQPETPIYGSLLTDEHPGGDDKEHQWIRVQMWGRQP